MPIAKYADSQRKWVEKNPTYIKEYYEQNKRRNWDNSNARRRYLTEAKKFRNILIDLVELIEIA